MNIDTELINRALIDAGEEPITDEDIKNNCVKYRTIAAVYLPTILETLSKVDWTSRKKRMALTASDTDCLPDGMRYAYLLPVDCARPVSIDGNAKYVTESKNLFCNIANPTLLYISNGRISSAAQYLTTETYPEYENISFDPMLSLFIETKIAAKVAKKITGNEKLFATLYQEAANIEIEAETASRKAARSSKSGKPYWVDSLGLSDTEGNYADN